MPDFDSQKGREQTVPRSDIFDVVTPDQVSTVLLRVSQDLGVNLAPSSVQIVRPGDPVFDLQEIQYKLLMQSNGDYDTMIKTITSYGFDPQNTNLEEFRQIAAQEDIQVTGELPGFAMTSGDDELLFFAVKRSNAVSMATTYAQKEGLTVDFKTENQAIAFLKSLAEKALLHEIGHLIYHRIDHSEWDKYVDSQPALKQKVIELQIDKYGGQDSIPIAEEAFADHVVPILSGGKIPSRSDF